MNRFAIAVVSAVLAISALEGCSSASGEGRGNETGNGSLTILSPEPSQGLDPNLAFADASRVPMAMMYETLVERDYDGQMVGSLASEWSVSEDALIYTFTMREGGKFSDGSAITAEDAVFSLERAQSGDVLAGALAGAIFEAPDEHTVTMTLEEPNNGILTSLATPGSAAILSQAAVEAGGDDYFTKPTATSGPFMLAQYVPKSHARFSRNPNYYNPPKLATINYTFSEDPTGARPAIESGAADITGMSYADAEALKRDSSAGIQIKEVDQLAPLFWGWDRTKAPFNDKMVRQAVAWSVDREGRISACWFGTGAVTYGNILRPWDPAYIEINTYQAASRDEALAKARDLLNQAGWVDDGSGTRVADGVEGVKDGTKFEVTVPYEGNWPAAECHVQLLQDNLSKVGIAVTPESYDPAAYWGDVSKNKFEMYHGGAGAIDAADLYFNWFRTGGSLTALTTHLDDEAINEQIDEARTETDPQKAIAIYQGLEQWQAEELPMLVVGYQWPQVALSSRVAGWNDHVDNDSRWLVDIDVA